MKVWICFPLFHFHFMCFTSKFMCIIYVHCKVLVSPIHQKRGIDITFLWMVTSTIWCTLSMKSLKVFAAVKHWMVEGLKVHRIYFQDYVFGPEKGLPSPDKTFSRKKCCTFKPYTTQSSSNLPPIFHNFELLPSILTQQLHT